jgi:pimeloyl-ACP methyl ester carboxylesterase
MVAVTLAIVIGVIVVGVPAVVMQRRLIYHPTIEVPPPAVAGVPDAEPLEVTAADGTTLASWYVPADGAPVGAVLVLHGNAGNRAHRGPLAAALARRGLATLLLDYRGFGGSDGRPSEEGLIADARAAADALRRRSGLPAARTVYFGESLGSAVAARLAAERHPAALVLRSPFPSLTDVGARLYPWLPVRLLLRDRFETTERVAAFDGAVLAVAGERDRLIPPELSRQVVDGADDARLLTVEGAAHNDRALLDGAVMLDGITTFLRERADIPVRDPVR